MEKTTVFLIIFLIVVFILIGLVVGVMYFLIYIAATSEAFDFDGDCLYEHNWYREKHRDTGPLTLSANLIDSAKKSVEGMASSEGIVDKLSEDIGENSWSESIASGQSEDRFSKLKCGDAVSKWYSEQKLYIYGISDIPLPAVPLTRDFTQMVWKSTKQLGCAKSYNKDYVYLVCHYSPKGNDFTQYKDNVMPKTGKLIWK